MQVLETDSNEAAVVLGDEKVIKNVEALGPVEVKGVLLLLEGALRLAEYLGKYFFSEALAQIFIACRIMKIVKLSIHLVKPAGDDHVLRLKFFTEENGGEDLR